MPHRRRPYNPTASSGSSSRSEQERRIAAAGLLPPAPVNFESNPTALLPEFRQETPQQQEYLHSQQLQQTFDPRRRHDTPGSPINDGLWSDDPDITEPWRITGNPDDLRPRSTASRSRLLEAQEPVYPQPATNIQPPSWFYGAPSPDQWTWSNAPPWTYPAALSPNGSTPDNTATVYSGGQSAGPQPGPSRVPIPSSSSSSSRPRRPSGVFPCDKCSKTCSRPGDLARHKRHVHENIRYRCEHTGCSRVGREDKMKAHSREAHRGVELYFEIQ